MSKYLRGRLSSWKKESLSFYNYRCQISGKNDKNLEIHHIHRFHLIVEETLLCLDIPLKYLVEEYEEDELKTIEETFLVIHEKYGFGVPMKKKIHKDFHFTYGFNNSQEQLDEFKLCWNIAKNIA